MFAPIHLSSRAPSATASLLIGALLCAADGPNEGLRQVASPVFVLNDNGAWSWFEDERAVVDPVARTLLVSSVADASGSGGAARDGNVEVAVHDLTTGTTRRAVLHAHLEDDDHDSASLYVRCDGRYVAMYSTHATDTLSRWRLSREPGLATAWGAERTLDHGASATYSNIYPVGAGSSLYALVRAAGNDPHVLISDDDGATWQQGGRLLDGPGRPYVRYAADHLGRLHLLTTEQHPHNARTSIYHGMIVDGRLLRSDGTVVDADLSDDVAVRPERLTRVFAADVGMRAWTVDLHVDGDGRPSAVFSVHTRRHEYWYARGMTASSGTLTSSPTPAPRCTTTRPTTPVWPLLTPATPDGWSCPPTCSRTPAFRSSALPTASNTTSCTKARPRTQGRRGSGSRSLPIRRRTTCARSSRSGTATGGRSSGCAASTPRTTTTTSRSSG